MEFVIKIDRTRGGDQERVEQVATELLPKAQKCESLSEDLHGMNPREQLDVALKIARQTEEQRKSNKHLPELEVYGDYSGLTNIICVEKPDALIFKNKKDVFDFPEEEDSLLRRLTPRHLRNPYAHPPTPGAYYY